MSLIVWTNNASSTMASSITNVQTTVTVQAGQGALYPNPSAGQYFMATFEDVSGNIEITKCTGRSGDTLTVVRAQESTGALAFASGSRVELRITAGMMATLLQHTGDTLSDATLTGILTLGGGGSIRGGESAGMIVRGTPGDTTNQLVVPAGGGAPYLGATTTNVILTPGNIAANLPSGTALIQTGMIFYWFGNTGSIPTGFTECNGSFSSPDMRNTFVVAAGVTYPQGTTGGSLTSGGPSTANTGTYSLTVADLPSHSHNIKYITFGVQGGGSLVTGQPIGSGGLNASTDPQGSGTAHSHTLSAHTHTLPAPPYHALVMIMKK